MNNNYKEKTIPKIVFLLGSISQPRCIKRINSFINNDFDIEIFGIDRGVYNENSCISNHKITILTKQADGKDYLRKAIETFVHVKRIVRERKSEKVIFYSFGFVMTFALFIAGCKRYIYEISDILYAYKKFDSIRWMLKLIDKIMIKKSFLTVYTSGGFSEYYFNNKVKNTIVQANKLDHSFYHKKREITNSSLNINSLNFAYVGAFRYPDTVFRFARIIGENYKNHKFHFYGDSYLTDEVKKIAAQYENVLYHGSFKNPGDLYTIYNNIDIVVACYDTKSLNERIAEPNKFYESLYFIKPIIVSDNTFVGKKVKEFNSGFCIDAHNDINIINFIESINSDIISDIHNSITSIPLEDIIDDNSKKIIKYIKEHATQ